MTTEDRASRCLRCAADTPMSFYVVRPIGRYVVRPIGRLFYVVRPIGRYVVRPIGRLFLDVLGVLVSIYRVFPRVILRVRVILDSILFGLPLVVHPRRRLGGTGGPVAPLAAQLRAAGFPAQLRAGFPRAREGGSPLDVYNVIYGDPLWSIYSPLSKGGRGVPHSSLLAVTVRTDTKGVGLGFKGSPTVPIRCDVCGLPLKACQCLPGLDY